jgi:structural maintenance of chromosome 1
MDIDEEDGTQRPRVVPDFGIEVDFDELDEDERTDGSTEMSIRMEEEISRILAEIEKMAPNMKAVER